MHRLSEVLPDALEQHHQLLVEEHDVAALAAELPDPEAGRELPGGVPAAWLYSQIDIFSPSAPPFFPQISSNSALERMPLRTYTRSMASEMRPCSQRSVSFSLLLMFSSPFLFCIRQAQGHHVFQRVRNAGLVGDAGVRQGGASSKASMAAR